MCSLLFPPRLGGGNHGCCQTLKMNSRWNVCSSLQKALEPNWPVWTLHSWQEHKTQWFSPPNPLANQLALEKLKENKASPIINQCFSVPHTQFILISSQQPSFRAPSLCKCLYNHVSPFPFCLPLSKPPLPQELTVAIRSLVLVLTSGFLFMDSAQKQPFSLPLPRSGSLSVQSPSCSRGTCSSPETVFWRKQAGFPSVFIVLAQTVTERNWLAPWVQMQWDPWRSPYPGT